MQEHAVEEIRLGFEGPNVSGDDPAWRVTIDTPCVTRALGQTDH